MREIRLFLNLTLISSSFILLMACGKVYVVGFINSDSNLAMPP